MTRTITPATATKVQARIDQAVEAVKGLPAAPGTCGCGCGLATRVISKNKGSAAFIPGHDARLVSNLAWATAAVGGRVDLTGRSLDDLDIMDAIMQIATQIQERYSHNLAIKFENAAHTAWEYAVANVLERTPTTKAQKAAASLIGRRVQVKVGRWTYDGTVTSVTVDSNGNETAGSEVCGIDYTDAKGNHKHIDADSSKWADKWWFAI